MLSSKSCGRSSSGSRHREAPATIPNVRHRASSAERAPSSVTTTGQIVSANQWINAFSSARVDAWNPRASASTFTSPVTYATTASGNPQHAAGTEP
jgi:hypothetical protein